MRGRLALAAVALCAVPAARADAATFCVEVAAPGCAVKATVAEAFAAARADSDRDTIMLLSLIHI